MADIDGISNLGIDIGNSVSEAIELSESLNVITAATKNLAGALVKFNNGGEATSLTLKVLDDAGQLVSTTFKAVYEQVKEGERFVDGAISGYEATAQSITKVADALKTLNRIKADSRENDLKDRRNAEIDAQRNIARAALRSQADPSKLANATPSEINSFQNAVDRASSVIGTGDIQNAAQLSAIFARATSGANDLSIAEQRVASVLRGVLEASDKLGASFTKAQNTGNKSTSASEVAKQAAKDLAEAKRNEDAIIALYEASQKRKSAARKRAAADDAAAAAQASKVNTAADVSAASQAIGRTFGPALASANPAQILAYNSALSTSLGLLQSNKVSLAQFIDLFGKVRAGNITGGLTGPLADLQKQLVSLQSAFNITGQSGEKAGSKIFLSFQNIIRIFESQVLYAVFNKIQSGFTEATGNAAEYSKQVGLIQTISQDANVSTTEWTQGVRALSDQLGLPIADAAGATYEALSNQVAKGADAFRFLGTAGEFARTTNSTLTDSVNLISAALNSFDLKASEADRVAKSFFTTIDLGRVKTPELANSFGRIATQAAQLGISLEEINATISTLTRQGIKANETYTLLGNIVQKLVKPTDALQAQIQKLGYANASQGIAGEGGVVPFLIRLRESSADARVAVASLFDEIRGRRGFENLTADGGKAVLGDIAAQKTSTNQYDKAKDIVTNTFGQQFEVQINKIKNFFTVDVGGTFLQAVVNLSNLVGGLSNRLIQLIGVLTKVAAIAAAAFAIRQAIALYTALGQASAAVGLLRTAFLAAAGGANILAGAELAAGAAASVLTGGLSLIAAAVATVLLANANFFDQSEATLRELTATYQSEADKTVQIEQQAADKRSRAFNDGIDKAKGAIVKFSSTIRSELQKSFEGLDNVGNNIGDKLKAQLDLVSGTIRSQLQELEGKLKATVTLQNKNVQREVAIPGEYNDELYRRKVAINDHNAGLGGVDNGLNIQADRLKYLRETANGAVLDVKQPERLEKILEEIDKVSEDIFQRALKTNSNRNLNIADSILLDNAKSRLNLLNLQNRALEKQRLLLENQVDNQKSLFEQFQEAQKRVLSFSVTDKKGDVKEEYRGSGGADKAAADLKTSQSAVIELLNKIGASTDTRIHTATESAKQLAELQKLFGQQGGNAVAQVKTGQSLIDLGTIIDRDVDKIDLLKKKYSDLQDILVQGLNTQQQTLVTGKSVTAAISGKIASGSQNTGDAFQNFLSRVNGDRAGEIGTNGIGVQKQSDALSKILNSPNFTKDKGKIDEALKAAEDLKKLIAQASAAGGGGASDPNAFGNTKIGPSDKPGGPDLTFATGVEKTIEALKGLRNSSAPLEETQKALDIVGNSLRTLEAQAQAFDRTFRPLGVSAEEAAKGIVNGLSPAKAILEEFTSELKTLKEDFKSLGELKATASPPDAKQRALDSILTPQAKAKGGMVGYYDSGGFVNDFLSGKFAKGTDTVPVMATPGEYIVDAANTRKFLPILRSMSEGSYRPSPSGVSNTTTVGDIKITVQGGSSAPQTVKEIASGLRRGIRQGTVRLQ